MDERAVTGGWKAARGDDFEEFRAAEDLAEEVRRFTPGEFLAVSRRLPFLAIGRIIDGVAKPVK